jgi:2,5-diketo-D-gluconate reductase B
MSKDVKTQDGIPIVGFGLYALSPESALSAVTTALECGYRHFDTAQSYGNEEACGIAIERSGVPRSEIFVTTKVTPRNYPSGRMLSSVKASLDCLRSSCVDLLLIHYPSPWNEVPIEVYLEQLLEIQQAGLARLIGISNFTIAQTDRAVELLGRGNVATNQVEIHVFMQNRPIVDHCRRIGITTTAYCALARGTVFGAPEAGLGPHSTLLDVAREHGATVGQIALAFLIHEGHVVLSTTIVRDQILENIRARDISLTPTDMERLRRLDLKKRIVEWPYFPVFDS